MPNSEPLIDITQQDALYKILSMKRNYDDDSEKPIFTDFASFQTVLKKKYRRAALKHHPDSGGLEENFRSVALAYEILNDERKKEWLDSRRGVFSQSDYEEYLEMEKFSSHFSEQAFQSLIMEKTFVANAFLNKILNIGWKLVQIGAFAALMFGILLLDVFWQSDNWKIHWILSASSTLAAYLYWGRILSCWCIMCWCFAPWTAAILVPIVYSIRWPLWIGIKAYTLTEMVEKWRLGVITVGCFEILLHFFYGYSWTSALYYSVLIYIFRPLIVVLFLSGTLVAQLLRLRALYMAIFSVVLFFLDIFWLHWLPVGYTKKLFMIIWMVIFLLSSPGGDVYEDEQTPEDEEMTTESITPTYAPPPPEGQDWNSSKGAQSSESVAPSPATQSFSHSNNSEQRDKDGFHLQQEDLNTSDNDVHEFNQ